MTLVALLLAASAVDLDRTVQVPSGDLRVLNLPLKTRPAALELEYQATSPVRVIVIPKSEESRLRAGRDYREISSTSLEQSGKLRVLLATPGEYAVVVDNRQDAENRVAVRLRGSLQYDTTPGPARYLPRQRRILVITSSLLFFCGVCWFAGRRLWAVTGGRRRPAPPPPSE
ncbi:MAG: hypothetical protein HY235_14005 [Acidobacteria bacterium]|nr:hypothetical protein [Acidobacteriota bacterium]